MSLPVLILGAGGHAKVLIDALLAGSAAIAGLVDSDPGLSGTSVLGIPILGGDDVVTDFPPAEILLVDGLGSVGLPLRRHRLFNRFKDLGYSFATVVHPSAVVACDVALGEGTQVMAGAVIQPGTRIGVNVIINTRASVDHDCVIGDHAHLAPGVTLSGGVQVGAGCHLGTAATVIQGVVIGAQSLVAAGAVVTCDLDAGAKVRGVPAREFT